MNLSGMQGGRRRPLLPQRFGDFQRPPPGQQAIRHPEDRAQQRGRQSSHHGDQRQGRTSNLAPSSLAALVPHTGPAAAERDKDAWCSGSASDHEGREIQSVFSLGGGYEEDVFSV